MAELIPAVGAIAAVALTATALAVNLPAAFRLGLIAAGLLVMGSGLLWLARQQSQYRRTVEERFAEMSRQRAELERLLDASVSAQLRAGIRPDIQAVLGELARTITADAAACYLLDRESGILVPQDEPFGLTPGTLQDHRISSQDEDPLNQALIGGKPYLRQDGSASSYRLLPRSFAAHSLLVAPMVVDEEVVGIIVLGSRSPDRFSEKDVDVAMANAAMAGTALVNERLLSSSRQALRHSGVVKEVALAVNSTLELNHVLHLFLGKARGVVEYDRASVALFEAGQYRIAALVDAEGNILRRPVAESQGKIPGSVFDSVRGGTIVVRRSLGQDDNYATEKVSEARLGVAFSEVLVPLRSKGEVVGCVAFRSPRANGFADGLHPALYELANLGGMAITNSMVHQGTASQARHLDLLLNSLSEVSRMLTATTEGPRALEKRTVTTVSRLYDSPLALLTRVIDGEHRIVAASGSDVLETGLQDTRVVPGSGLLGAVALQQETTRRLDTDAADLLPPLLFNPAISSGLAAPMFLDGQFQGALAVFGDHTFDEDEATVLTTVANQVAVALRNAELFERNERSLRELANLHEGLQAITSSLDMEHVLNNILTKAAAVSGAQIGSVMLLEDGHLVVRATFGTDGPTAQTLILGIGDGIAGKVVQTKKPILANDVQKHPSFRPGPPGGIVPKALLCVPMSLGEDVIGVINLSNYLRTDVFEQESVRVVTALASQTSIAVENARLYQHLRAERDRLISLEEVLRQDLARDLHDGPVQRLAGMAMNIEVIKTLMSRDQPRALRELDELEALVHKTMREARTMLFELRPLVLETQGLPAALRSYADQFETNTGLQVELEVDEDLDRFPPAVEQTIFSVIQEGLGNVRKHARATKVTVALHMERDQIVGRVTDDGRGFDVKAVQEGYAKREAQSLGLVNMVERAERIGGDFKLDSAPGRGTSVSISVPRRFLHVATGPAAVDEAAG
jgi:signal transduction histidine kinase